uniref:PF07600 family protein n=1 Tax=Leptospira ellisii TaxID=2023197 RepID=A0A2N0B6B9_9LEPT|nr:hypothetical protein CH379_15045 [Leptospira ellisii]
MSSSPSDFWIPNELAPLLRSRISKYGSLKKVLRMLLEGKRNRLHSLFRFSKCEKTLYQSKDLELIRFSFRPNAADWAEMRLAARYYGVSICYFFVMLLSLQEERSGSGDTRKGIYKKEKLGIILIQEIIPERNRIAFSIFLKPGLRDGKRGRSEKT